MKKIVIKINFYCIKINFDPKILGQNAVALHKDNPMITRQYHYHQYMCAN